MKTDRKWIALALLLLPLMLTVGCAKKAPETAPTPPPPPPPPPMQEVAPPPPPMTDMVEPKQEPTLEELQADLARRGLLGDVFFDFDKYDLRTEAQQRLAKNADFMKSGEGQTLTFTIEGHCDERGTNEYNLALGQRRAAAALDFLVSNGVAAGRLKTVSYGEERPFCTQSTETCWQENRRARFVITGR